MKEKFESVKNVLLFHDVNATDRIGFQSNDSRYLLGWEQFKSFFILHEKNFKNFERIVNQSFKDTFIRVTIDDGGGSCMQIAKFLADRNIKAYFFIVTSLIGEPKFLTKKEIKAIFSMGHKIGSHSHSHPHPFHMLTKEEIFDEINTSKIILKEIINSPVNIFSVPGGEINKKTLKILSDPFLDLDEVYISTPYQGRISSINLSKTKFYGRLCIDAKMNPNAVQKHIQGKGWVLARLNYQLRRLRREILYKYSALLK